MNEFDKIFGYESEKQEMLRLCDVLCNCKKYESLGITLPKAVLFYGEPGLGKTLMAKAFIEATDRKVFQCKKNKSNGEFVDEIKSTFENAIKDASSIIFFDDMDKFAEDNLQQDCNKEEFVAIQTGLEDIVDKDVFVIATANDINNLPESLLRVGRFGKKLQFSAPSLDDSVKIIRHYLASKKVSSDVKPESLAHILHGHSCAMLENVINEAGIYAAYNNAPEITIDHIREAVSTVMIERIPLSENDTTKPMIAYHEAGHAVMHLLAHHDVGCLAIGKCGKDGLGVGICTLAKPEKLASYEEMHNFILMLLSGKAGSELQFGTTDTGVEKDVKEAMSLIQDNLQLSLLHGFEYCYTTYRFDESQSYRQLDKNQEKAVRLLEEYYHEAKSLLLKHKELLDAIANELLEKEILIYDDIIRIVERYSFD